MTIHSVAKHLAANAGRPEENPPADAFARSAFNRYYYAAYLTVREFISEYDANWKRTGHADVPSIVEDSLAKKIKREADKLKKKSFLSESDYSRIISTSKLATKSMASIMRSAYSIRCLSDYEPEVKVVFETAHFSIKGTTNKEAENWKSRIEMEMARVRRITKEVGLD